MFPAVNQNGESSSSQNFDPNLPKIVDTKPFVPVIYQTNPSVMWRIKWTATRRFMPEQMYGSQANAPDQGSTLDAGFVRNFSLHHCKSPDLLPVYGEQIVLAVRGICKSHTGTYNTGNEGELGQPMTALLFEKDSKWNKAKLWDQLPIAPLTNLHSELMACDMALSVAQRLRGKDDTRLRKVVIKTDVKVIVEGLTEFTDRWAWKDDSLVTYEGKPIEHDFLYNMLEARLNSMKKAGYEVLFLLALKHEMKDVDDLTRAAMNQPSVATVDNSPGKRPESPMVID